MGEDVTLSVALTTYNGCPFIGPQLQSIAAQTRPPDEIVIGDDQSQDDTPLVSERFAATSEIPTHFHRNPKRLGIARNFEHVVRRCRGDIVVFADQDDVWLPHRLATLEAALRDAPDALGVFSNGLFIDERGARLPGTLFDRCAFDAGARLRFGRDGALGELVRRNVVTGATLAVRRSALLPLLPFDAFWPHDYYMALGLSVLGRLLVIEDPLICYRRHARQHTGFPAKSWRGVLQLVRGQSAAACARESAAFEQLCLRLISLGVDDRAPVIEVLRGKRRILAQRAEMRRQRIRAPALMWRGLRDGSYRDFSIGWKQLIIDLVALGVSADHRASPNP
jgi:glycosyltransferase involved in cell wall biosynthesis